jgi:hypothetical protein
MVFAAPVWTYWISFWWLGVDAMALIVLGVGYIIKVLRPGIGLRRTLAVQARAQAGHAQTDAFVDSRAGRPPLPASSANGNELGPPGVADVMPQPARREETVRRAD